MKDKLLKNETTYEVHWFDKVNNAWSYYRRCPSEKTAKRLVEAVIRIDKENNVVYKYRIVKCTTKMEVINDQ